MFDDPLHSSRVGHGAADDTPIVVSEGTRSSNGGYVQADYRVAKNVNVIGGFQANKIGQSPVTVVPRAGLPALGNPATDTVPYNKGRAAYLGLKVGF